MIRILKFFGVSFLFLLLLYILLLTLPYVAHKKVPQEILDRIRSAKYYSELPGAERAAYIDDNTDALLYRLNLIDQAEKEIIFSTFDFNVDEAGKDIMASFRSRTRSPDPDAGGRIQRYAGCEQQPMVRGHGFP